MLSRYRSTHDVASDYANWLLGRRGEFTPPRHIFREARVGGEASSFKAGGQMVFKNIVEIAKLKPSETVLEVGCGIGRNAVPLTKYLDQNGKYEGVDIVPISIGWCQRRITPKYPNFQFRLANVYNEWYNPKGKFKASEYTFPYRDETFDLVFLLSVFTHMAPEELEHYLSEIVRVLRNDGRCMITYLLLNSESLALLESGSREYELKDSRGPCRVIELKNPIEGAVAYEEDYIRSIYRKSGLSITGPILYGNWVGRKRHPWVGQDIILGKKYGRMGLRPIPDD